MGYGLKTHFWVNCPFKSNTPMTIFTKPGKWSLSVLNEHVSVDGALFH